MTKWQKTKIWTVEHARPSCTNLYFGATSLGSGSAGYGLMKHQPSTCITTARQTQLHAETLRHAHCHGLPR